MAIVTFPFNQGQVYSNGTVVPDAGRVYAYIDDTVVNITFDSSVYKISFFAFNGDTSILFTSWITESPYTIPTLSAHTLLGINVAKLSGGVTPEQAQTDIIFRNNLPIPVNLDIIVVNPVVSNGISLNITGGNTVSVAANSATGAQYGTVQTRSAADPQLTAASVSVVPTQYYVQTEIARLTTALDGAIYCEPISSYTEP